MFTAADALSFASLLKAGGFVLAMIGMVCWFTALRHVAAGESLLTTVWLGNLQGRHAFTDEGWRWRQCGVRCGVLGAALAGMGILGS